MSVHRSLVQGRLRTDSNPYNLNHTSAQIHVPTLTSTTSGQLAAPEGTPAAIPFIQQWHEYEACTLTLTLAPHLSLRGPAFLPPQRPSFICSVCAAFVRSPADLVASS